VSCLLAWERGGLGAHAAHVCAERLPSRMAPPLVPSMRALKQFLLTSWASPKQIPLYRRTVIFIRGFHG